MTTPRRPNEPDPFAGIDPTTHDGQRQIRQITDARLREIAHAKARKDREDRERQSDKEGRES